VKLKEGIRLKITDKIYGEFIIESVLEELINSTVVQRLKYIHQGGASYLVNKKWNVTRYEHSIGVMLLIRKLGGSVEEQIAGLLHDVSHTSFSHVVDLVFKNNNEDYHEKIYNEMIIESEIPHILAKYDYHYDELLSNMSQWKLLEQPAPELCADRIDYTLRDMYEYGHISLRNAHNFLDHLIVVDGQIYLDNINEAEWFVDTYYKEVIGFFLDPVNVYGYEVLSKTLKLALEKSVINVTDLLGTDEEVMELLRLSKNQEIDTLLNQLHPEIKVIEDEINFDFHLKKKVRLIDPSIWIENKLYKASHLSDKVQTLTINAERKAKKGVYIKILSK
jgi:uncharacterized protein